MAKKNGYTADQVIKALQDAAGYVSKAASILGCSSQTVYNYKNKFVTVADAWDAIREARHDFVENKLHEQINKGNVTSIIFYLKTQAKQRGYVERQELTGAKGQALRIKFLDYGLSDGDADTD